MIRAVLALCLLAIALPASAQTLLLNYGHVTKRANGATNAEVIFPARSGVITRLVSYDVTGDAAGAILKLQGGTYGATVNAISASSATNATLLGNSFIVAGDTVVFQKADNTTFSALVDTTNGLTLTFVAQLGTALAVGDKAYRMGLLATNAIAAATVSKEGPAIFAAPLFQPLRLLSFGNTTATAINSATAAYGTAPEY